MVLIFLTNSQMLLAQNSGSQTVSVRHIFPRGAGYEDKIMNVIDAHFGIDVNSNLGKIFARLSLSAAEVYYSNDNAITADKVIYAIGSDGRVKAGVQGLLAVLVMNEASKAGSDPQLREWCTVLYRSMKVRAAKSILDEYQKWDADYCNYKADGYKPPVGCGVGSLDQMSMYSKPSPPQDIIAKAGLKTVLGNDADKVADILAIGTTAATVGVSAMALSTIIGTAVWTSSTTAAASTITLGSAFMGISEVGAIGAAGWASVVAAPVAAAVLIVVVGTTEGIRVVEATKVEPMLKMKLGQAMTEYISLPNVFAEVSGRNMFFMAFMEAASKGFKLTPANIGGEVRFYCQAGYVSKFSLTYTTNVDKTGFKPEWKTVTNSTQDLPLGREQSLEIPYDAKNIRVQGQYWDGVWKSIFDQTLVSPTYMCYTSYGTTFNPNYKTDCPEVGNMVAKKNEITVSQGGAYTAWVYLSYKQNGKIVVAQDQQGIPIGWRKVYQIPSDATQIYLYIRDATGLLGNDAWRAVVEKTWPVPPNECIKVYGTTLDPKWNSECN